MLCPGCRRHVDRGASRCDGCGRALSPAPAPLELVLADASRVPVVSDMTIGRSPASTVCLPDPSVSRLHARIRSANGAEAMIEDAGSSYGTWMDGVRVTRPTPLHDGARLRMGDQELVVERPRDPDEAARTVVVELDAPSGAAGSNTPAGEVIGGAASQPAGMRPRLRPGYALKRLEAAEGSRRWVLKDLRSGAFLRMSDSDAQLFESLDGTRSLLDLIAEAERRFGPAGRPRLIRLLGELGERGFLLDVAASHTGEAQPAGLRRWLQPRERAFTGVGRHFEALYRHGGWVLFTRPSLVTIAILATAGVGLFGYLVAARYGTPLVVAERIGWGGLAFLLGRFAVVAVHELAHGLAMASSGRRVERVGLKLILIFPYAYVDTSAAWFEPRRRRLAISAAGPVSDLALGGLFSAACLLLDAGVLRDVFFQLAFAAYVGAFFNLNPLMDRDGYHMLVDVLREPGLRRRAQAQFARRLSGRGRNDDSPVLARYALLGLGWSLLAAGFAILLSLRYAPVMTQYAPELVVWLVLGTLWAALFAPVVLVVGRPLLDRFRGS